MALNIDLDRGVLHRRTTTGVDVFMYYDTPGVFLNAYGAVVADSLAAEAGFDVERLSHDKRRRETMDAAMREIEEQYGSEAVREVKAERNGYKLIHVGLNRYNIEAPDESRLNPRPLTDVEANGIFNQLVPPEPVPFLALKGGKKDDSE